MPNGFVLRWAAPADAGPLAEAAAAFFTDTFAADNRPENLARYLASAFSVERQRQDLEDPGNRILLAIDDAGKLAGYAHMRFGARPQNTPLAGATDAPVIEIARLYAAR